jgi:hypothetical protein
MDGRLGMVRVPPQPSPQAPPAGLHLTSRRVWVNMATLIILATLVLWAVMGNTAVIPPGVAKVNYGPWGTGGG